MLTFRAKKRELTYGQHSNNLRSLKGCKINHFGRTKVIELRARGMTHQEIASELQVSRTLITSDIAYLREQAKGTIKEYVAEHLPEQYQVCVTALEAIIKRAFDIIETSD